MQPPAARQSHFRHQTPTGVLHSTARNIVLFHLSDERLDVVAQQIEFLGWCFAICLMN